MPYIKEICVAGNTIEISKYFTYRFHSSETDRQKKEELTSEAMKKINQRNAVKRLRRLLNTNFSDGDYLIRLDFNKVSFENSIEMQSLTQKAIRKIKNAYKKSGLEFKYVYVKEIGPKGSKHLHMVCNRADLDLISKNWSYGFIHVDVLSSNGQYAKIAEYFIKYANKTEQTEGTLIGKRWYGSRNLLKPKISKRIIKNKKFKEDPKDKKGFYVDKNSISYGISELTGYEYFTYTLIKIIKPPGG